MSLTLEQIVARLGDPQMPVLWLDPSLSERLWEQLPAATRAAGFDVFTLDASEPVADVYALLVSFARLAPPGYVPIPDLAALRRMLLALPPAGGRGRVVLFRQPETLRQNHETDFEEFIELLASVHEARWSAGRESFQLVVRD
jgi:hypothetical protein